MKFFARLWENKVECLMLDDNMDVLFHLRVPQNTIKAWEVGIEKWAYAAPMKLKKLLSEINKIKSCQLQAASRIQVPIVFLKVLSAIAHYLDRSPDHAVYATPIHEILASNYSLNLIVKPEREARAALYMHGRILPCPLPSGVQIQDISGEWDRFWFTAFPISQEAKGNRPDALAQWSVENIKEILSNIELLDTVVSSQLIVKHSNLALMPSYAGLLKALRLLLEEGQIPELLAFRRTTLPYLYALLVKNEAIDTEEEKFYLDLIFANTYIKARNREKLLLNIANDLKQDKDRDPKYTARLSVMATVVTQYYLRRYDINRTLQLWESMGDKSDKFLQTLLKWYKYPGRYVLLTLGILATLFIIPPRHYIIDSPLSLTSEYIFISMLLLISLIGLWIQRHLYRSLGSRLSYIELFFPRLLGAIVTGLSVLLFESTVWDITCKIGWGNLVVLLIGTYTASYLYFLVDVHKTMRSLSSDGKEQEERFPDFHISSLKVAWRIFLIGLLDALVTTFIISGLLGEVFIQDIGKDAIESCVYHVIEIGPALQLVYIPRLILLWAGLSLFIGAFAQLLWQDHQVTVS